MKEREPVVYIPNQKWDAIVKILCFLNFRDLMTLRQVDRQHESLVFKYLVTLLGRPTTKIACGQNSSTIINPDGNVWTCGQNNGYLGLGSTTDTVQTFKEIPLLVNINQLAYGPDHTLALSEKGIVWAWGNGFYGQLGLADLEFYTHPQHIKGLIDVVAVACGQRYSLALRNDGTVWAWGRNSLGELGLGHKKDCSTPQKVVGIDQVRVLLTGKGHTLALRQDGSVWAWGDNCLGQLGLGHNEDRSVPEQVMTNVQSIAIGQNQSFAIKKDGSVWAWGGNQHAELGLGHTNFCNTPQEVGLAHVASLVVGNTHAFAIAKDGTVFAWGDNRDGQLGLGEQVQFDRPHKIPGLTDIKAIATGHRHTLALHKDGTVSAWGDNKSGQLGLGHTEKRKQPEKITTLANVKDLAAGSRHSIILKSNGRVVCWGYNQHGQLGLGHKDDSAIPQEVLPLGNAVVRKLLKGTITRDNVRSSWILSEEADQALLQIFKSLTSKPTFAGFFTSVDENFVNFINSLMSKLAAKRDYVSVKRIIKMSLYDTGRLQPKDKEKFEQCAKAILELLERDKEDLSEQRFKELNILDEGEDPSANWLVITS